MSVQNELPAQTQHVIAYPGSTKWTNPTNRSVTFKLHKGPPAVKRAEFPGGAPKVLDTGFLQIEIKPGDSVLLPSVFDDAIQTYDDAGVVQWGLAPQLVKNDSSHEMHPALDPLEQQKIENERKAVEAMMEKQNADTAVLLATGKRVEAERLQKEASDAQNRDRSSGFVAPSPSKPPEARDDSSKRDEKRDEKRDGKK